MKTVKVTGSVDENHHLSAQVPEEVRPGPVTILIVPYEDEAGNAWADAVAEEWADELNDTRQDIYTIADGDPMT